MLEAGGVVALNRRLPLWIVGVGVVICATSLAYALASSKRYSGIVRDSLPRFDFTINEAEAAGAERINSIEVYSAKKLLQTIRFEDDENAPIDFASGDLVTLEDVDCNGYKDLLVRSMVGVHGDAWYHLYRFDPAKNLFIEYVPFTDLAYTGVNCHTGIVSTYVNSGAAGCIYEAGSYHWVNGELLPVRMESQDGGDNGSFRRTVRVWPNGKEVVLSSKSIPADDCHRAI
jgi:hypothetical protein